MPQTGFETEVPANERPQTNALDRAATGIGILGFYEKEIIRDVNICVTDAVLIGYQDHKWQTRKQSSVFLYRLAYLPLSEKAVLVGSVPCNPQYIFGFDTEIEISSD
jgi:hypothetical protein